MIRRKTFDVMIPPVVQREVNKLAGKRAGYGEVLAQLKLDPCNLGVPVNVDNPKAYRLSGPLHPVVCGTHLRHGYRLAYTTRAAPESPTGIEVVILYVGKKDDPAYGRGNDMWDLVHELFGAENPPTNHLKPPCCERDWPTIADHDLDEFEARLSGLRHR